MSAPKPCIKCGFCKLQVAGGVLRALLHHKLGVIWKETYNVARELGFVLMGRLRKQIERQKMPKLLDMKDTENK